MVAPMAVGPHIPGLLHPGKEGLVVQCWVGEQFIVVDLEDKGNFMGIAPGYRGQDPQGGGHGVAAAFDGQFDDIFRIKIDGVGRKGRRRRMLDALVHRQDGKITGPGQPAMIEQGGQGTQDVNGPITGHKYAVQEIRTRQMQGFFGKTFACIGQQRFRLMP